MKRSDFDIAVERGCIQATSTGRIHIALIDLHGSFSKRVDGGVGLSISEPKNSVRVKRLDDGLITVERAPRSAIEQEILDDVKSTLERARTHYGLGGVAAEVRRALPIHSGFGSKTQALLAVTAAYCRLYRKDYDVREMARMIGRGGTSGIGVEAFVSGGFIVDCGHAFEAKNNSFRPSSASKHVTPAPLVGRYEFPDWPILIVTPGERKQFFAHEERGHWNRVCPIPLPDAQACSQIVLMMLIPSVIEGNLDIFSEGINRIQALRWKSSLIDAQAPVVGKTIDCLHAAGLQGVGLSSAGGTVYAFGSVLQERESANRLLKEVGEFIDAHGGGDYFITTANNAGAIFVDGSVR